eukprot:GHRR01026485.1.p1 GENE.GHRR01026485.1~~GHRR01026485.1.p1  ORF type:complete len:117 (+),score=27.91 GHRR01026485.1:159-509(+)
MSTDKQPSSLHCRRTMLWSTTAGVTAWVTLNQAAQARQEPLNKEVDAAESPYIQELLRRSREKKEQRDKERLQDYYKRNFKDYFEFEGGSIRAGKARGIQPDTQQAILQWLELNKD